MKTQIKEWAFLGVAGLLSFLGYKNSSLKSNEEVIRKVEVRETPDFKAYKKMKIDYGYKNLYPDIQFENLNVPGSVGRWGVQGYEAKFIRGLRFKNITDAVEDRYNLPSGIIFSMMVEESNGVDLLPNALGDGGFGLCHMQPSVAHEFGLKTYKNCKGLVCNGKHSSSCKFLGKKMNHALALKKLIIKFSYNRKDLITYDDRLNPLENLDAVGRMLASYMDGPSVKKLGPLRTAICRYAGAYNYKAYWRDVKRSMHLLQDESFMKSLENIFNEKNPNLKINEQQGDFKKYIELSQQQNENYGLSEYKKLKKFKPKNSEIVKKSIKNFL